MPTTRLGRIKIWWCDNCNLPLIDSRCSACGKEGFPVNLTPPGDVRPAFGADIQIIRELTDKQFGNGCGIALLPEKKVVLLSRIPGEDRIDEIIVDGNVIGALRYEIFRGSPGFRVSLRMDGAYRIKDCIEKSWVIVDKGAVKSILKSSNVMVAGINDMAKNIKKGDEIVVFSPEKEVIAIGKAMIDSEEMDMVKRGVGVKVRVRGRISGQWEIPEGGQSWSDVLRANKEAMERNIDKSITFLRKSVEKYNLPIALFYSGGKDSLASLLLALDADMEPILVFLNTGIELPETIENARKTGEKYGLEYVEIDAGNNFWRGLKIFGPPAKDYRWCCKACKLGPITLFIKKNYSDGILSIIGQRRYESEARARKGKRWENPWVKGQIGISPIQDWTALEVWLYLFMKNAEYNPWYERGLHRIGCYLCPSADLGDAEIVKKGFEGYDKWEDYLRRYARNMGLSERWIKYGLWRWKRIPKWVKSSGFYEKPFGRGEEISFSGENPVVMSKKVSFRRIKRFASVLGRWREEGEKIIIENICKISENEIEIEDERERKIIEMVITQASSCIGCGVCVGRCSLGAISITDGMALVSHRICTSCRKCLEGPCPARDFSPSSS